MTWTCVECCLPDAYDGIGDGIGSCMCPRCESCGECQYCADALSLHPCGDEDDGYDDEWEPDDDGTAERSRWRVPHTIDVKDGLL
jgi:hypothetical protein